MPTAPTLLFETGAEILTLKKIARPKTKASRNYRVRSILKIIKKRKRNWRQHVFHCRTSHCFAGYAQLVARAIPLTTSIRTNTYIECRGKKDPDVHKYLDTQADAVEYLGLTMAQAGELFSGDNKFIDLVRVVDEICKTPYKPRYVGKYDWELV